MAKRASVYDLKGLNCPLPVLKAKKRLAAMQPGSRLWLETTDPLAVIDIPAFCSDAGHQLVASSTIASCVGPNDDARARIEGQVAHADI